MSLFDNLYLEGHHKLEKEKATKSLEAKMTLSIKHLFEKGTISLALLPEKNDHLLNEEGKALRKKLLAENKTEFFHSMNQEEKLKYLDLKKLEELDGYTVPLTIHDYGAKTPLMWNSLYEEHGINIRNFMVVANPEHLPEITKIFREDEKYLGGGMAVGFKEKIIPHLDEINPADLKSINIICKKDKKLVGQNTDSKGFIKSLEDKFEQLGKNIQDSNIVILGAGGVAKEVCKYLAEKKVGRIIIINRTYSKAVELANELNKTYGQISIGIGEDLIRGTLLNSYVKPDAVINLTDKGSDAMPDVSALAPSGPDNHTIARAVLEKLYTLYPNIIIADIVLPSKGRSISLRHADYYGFKNLLDGIPMVINQGAPAYKLIENAHPEKHKKLLEEEYVLKVMKESTIKK